MGKRLKGRPKKGHTQRDKVLSAMNDGILMTAKEIADITKLPIETVRHKLSDLRTENIIDRDGDHRYWKTEVKPAVEVKAEASQPVVETVAEKVSVPATAVVLPEKVEVVGDSQKGGKVEKDDQKDTQNTQKGVLDQRDLFTEHLKAIGVRRDVAPTITDMFFSGDIADLSWLKQVLHVQASGYVNPHQENITLAWWANSRQLACPGDLLVKLGGVKEEVKVVAKIEDDEGSSIMDPGIGWDIKKVDGDWIAVAGGPMKTHKEAADRAEKRQMMEIYGRQQHSVAASPPILEVKGEAPVRPPDLMDKMMDKMLENFFGGDHNKDKDNVLLTQIQALSSKIQELQDVAREKEMQDLRAMVGQLLQRDPFAEWEKVQGMRVKLGVTEGAPIITDQSPAVQLIKDVGDKFDKSTSRFLGVMERVILKTDQFNPEETRSPEEREAVASQLLDEVGEVRVLRQNVFGV